jgi:hypothetical protein
MKKLYFPLFLLAFLMFLGSSLELKAQVTCSGTIQSSAIPSNPTQVTIGNGTPRLY